MKTIMVDGKAYIPADQQLVIENRGDYKIIVLQRGWVLVGKLERKGSECKLHDAHVIRNWGTTKGLGELAEMGPLPNTKIDKCNGMVEFDYLTVVLSISVKRSAWLNVL